MTTDEEYTSIFKRAFDLGAKDERRRLDLLLGRIDRIERALIEIKSRPADFTPALDTAQASSYTGLAEATLEGFRCRGGGPRFVRYGRKAVRYLRHDLDAWMEGKKVSSTKEPSAT